MYPTPPGGILPLLSLVVTPRSDSLVIELLESKCSDPSSHQSTQRPCQSIHPYAQICYCIDRIGHLIHYLFMDVQNVVIFKFLHRLEGFIKDHLLYRDLVE